MPTALLPSPSHLVAALTIGLAGCAHPTHDAALAALTAEGQARLPAEGPGCRLPAGHRVLLSEATTIPHDLIRRRASGWAIVAFDMAGGVVTTASIVESKPPGLLDAYALSVVRKHANPRAPDASGCLSLVTVHTS